MQEYISKQSIFFTKETLLYISIFFLIRSFSFFLFPYTLIIDAITIVLLFFFGAVYFYSPPHALLIVCIELFLGGAGHFFSLFGISLRTLLLISFLMLMSMHQIGIHFYHEQKKIPNILSIGIGIWLLFVSSATIHGFVSGNGIAALQDAIPYGYLLLLFPAYAMYRRYDFLRASTARLAIVSIIGTSIYTLFNFALFSGGITLLQKNYYDWLRNINIAKITDLGDNFFRIVEPSHLLVVPFILLITSLLIRKEKHHSLWWILHALLVLTLSINFSRGYILALCIGLLVLILKHSIKRWTILSGYTVGLFLFFFLSLHTIASGFTNMGFDELGLRTASITNPSTEVSSATRIALLPAILQKMNQKPLFGHGLGSSIEFYNSKSKQYETTREYDWGYLELIAEFGTIGAIFYFFGLFAIGIALLKKIFALHDYQDFHVGILASFIALLVMNITAPVLSHVLGIVSIVFILLFITKPITVFDQFVIFLYQLFHSKK